MNKVLSTGVIVSSVLFCLSSSHAMRHSSQYMKKQNPVKAKSSEEVDASIKAQNPPLDAIVNDEKALLEAIDAENFAMRMYFTKKSVIKNIPGKVFDALAQKLGEDGIRTAFNVAKGASNKYIISIGMMYEKGSPETRQLILNAYTNIKNNLTFEYKKVMCIKDVASAVIAPDDASDSDDRASKNYLNNKTGEQKKRLNEEAIRICGEAPLFEKFEEKSASQKTPNVDVKSNEFQDRMKERQAKIKKRGYDENVSTLSDESRAKARSKSQERENARLDALKNHYETGMEKEVMKYAKGLDVSEKTIVEQKEKLQHVGS